MAGTNLAQLPLLPKPPALPQVPTRPEVEQDLGELVEALRLEQTFVDTPWTGWLMLLGCVVAGVVLGKLASMVLRKLGDRAAAGGWKTRGIVSHSAAGPAHLLLIAVGLRVGLLPVVMAPPVRAFAQDVVVLLYIVALGWFLYGLVDLVDLFVRRLLRRRVAAASQLDTQLLPLLRKSLRIFLIVVFALFTAENVFGADITAWLAGLGIAGLAVSLAAQDSIKNLFGSVTIFLDRPFGVGETVKFGNHTGTVEEIGFRSTRLRTLDGALVSVPNAKIVDSDLENVARRRYFRRVVDVTITYDTPPEKVEQAMQILRDLLAAPDIQSAFDMEKLPPRVFFNEFKADSLNLRVFYWFHPNNYWEFQEHGQRFNLRLLRAFNEAGIDFAFPTHTVYLASDPNRELRLRTAAGAGTDAGPGNGHAAGDGD